MPFRQKGQIGGRTEGDGRLSGPVNGLENCLNLQPILWAARFARTTAAEELLAGFQGVQNQA